jgi:predicted metal-dependent hydrolase
MHLPYRVEEDPRRTSRVAIHVDPDGTISVDAPAGFSDEAIKSAVQKRARWIAGHVVNAGDRFRQVRPKEYVSGEQVLYLGRRYVLKVIITPNPIKYPKLRGSRLEVQSKTGEAKEVRARMKAWYRERAREYYAQRLSSLVKDLPWVQSAPPFKIMAMSRQWGSCSPNGEIILNPDLIKAPQRCVNYVLIHEMAHLKYLDHGKEFWALLDRYAVGWPALKKELDANVELYTSN